MIFIRCYYLVSKNGCQQIAAQMKLLKMFRVEKPKCNANKFIYFFVGVRGAGRGSWLAGYRSQQSIIVHNIDICLLMSIK